MPTHTYRPIENQHANMDNMHEKWFRPNIDSKVLKQLTRRSNTPGWLNTISYFLLVFSTGYVAYLSWGTWWAIPYFLFLDQFILLQLRDGMNMDIVQFLKLDG